MCRILFLSANFKKIDRAVKGWQAEGQIKSSRVHFKVDFRSPEKEILTKF